MTEFKIPEPYFSLEEANLRQAVEWIAFGLKPLPKEYEAVIRKVEEIQNSNKNEIDHAKRLLVLALMEEKIFAYGEMISGDRFNEYRQPCWHALNRLSWDFNQIQWDKNEIFCLKHNNTTYGNIIFKFNDLVRTFPKLPNLQLKNESVSEIESAQKVELPPAIKPSSVNHRRPKYLSSYMQLLDLAVVESK